MTEHDDELYLRHVASMANLLNITRRLGRDRFDREADVRDATTYRLQTLAESTQRLSDEFKDAHPGIPWKDISRFRNRAVHGYLGIDPDIIWDIVESDIPALGRCVNDELDRRRVRPGHEQGRDLGDDLGLEL